MSETNDAPITIADDQAAQLSTRRSADGERAVLEAALRLCKIKHSAADILWKMESSRTFTDRAYTTRLRWARAADTLEEVLQYELASGASRVGTREDDIR